MVHALTNSGAIRLRVAGAPVRPVRACVKIRQSAETASLGYGGHAANRKGNQNERAASVGKWQLKTVLPARDVTRRMRFPQGPERYTENDCAADGASTSPVSASSTHMAGEGLSPADLRSMRTSAVTRPSDQLANTTSISLVEGLDRASHFTAAGATVTTGLSAQ